MIEALRSIKTLNEIPQQFEAHPTQVSQWKKALQEQATALFNKKRGLKSVVDPEVNSERFYSEIRRLKIQLNWLKKA